MDAYSVTVHWSRDYTPGDTYWIDEEDYDVLYAFISRSAGRPKVLYIGQAYTQYIGERIGNHHKLREAQRKFSSVKVRVGTVTLRNRSRITKSLVDAVENALICETEPILNERSIQEYTQNNDVTITNAGNYLPIPRKIDTRNWG